MPPTVNNDLLSLFQFPVQGAKDHNEMAEQVVECDYSLHGEYSIELKNVLKGVSVIVVVIIIIIMIIVIIHDCCFYKS